MNALSTAKWVRRWRRLSACVMVISALTAVVYLAAGHYPAATYFALITVFIGWQYSAMRVLHRHGHHQEYSDRVTTMEPPTTKSSTSSTSPWAGATPIMRYFEYGHLPEALAAVSRPFCELAQHIDQNLPGGPEKSVALRKLLESKDAAVRAALP